MPPVTLIPLSLRDHTPLLQAVYNAAPAYWALYEQLAAPELQALHDLREAGQTPGRTLMGILLPLTASPSLSATDAGGGDVESRLTSHASAEMVGFIDLRMHHPGNSVTTIGMIMVAEPGQRQGHASAALALLEAWLASSAGMTKLRAGVEQFNPGALHFFQHNGFTLTGEATRTQVGDRLVRQLYLEKSLSAP